MRDASCDTIKDSGEIETTWIQNLKRRNEPCECHTHLDDPINEGLLYYKGPCGHWTSWKHEVFRVEYDKRTGLVRRIIDQDTGRDRQNIGRKDCPGAIYIEVGKLLPEYIEQY